MRRVMYHGMRRRRRNYNDGAGAGAGGCAAEADDNNNERRSSAFPSSAGIFAAALATGAGALVVAVAVVAASFLFVFGGVPSSTTGGGAPSSSRLLLVPGTTTKLAGGSLAVQAFSFVHQIRHHYHHRSSSSSSSSNHCHGDGCRRWRTIIRPRIPVVSSSSSSSSPTTRVPLLRLSQAAASDGGSGGSAAAPPPPGSPSHQRHRPQTMSATATSRRSPAKDTRRRRSGGSSGGGGSSSSNKNRRRQLRWIVQSLEKIMSEEAEEEEGSEQQVRIVTPHLLKAMDDLARARTTSDIVKAGRRLEDWCNGDSNSRYSSIDGVAGAEEPDLRRRRRRRRRRRLLAVRERVMKAAAMTGLHSVALRLLDAIVLSAAGDDGGGLPSDIAQDAVCGSLRKAGRLEQLQSVIEKLGDAAAGAAAGREDSKISVAAFNIFLAALCDVATERDTSPKRTKKSRAEILRDAASWLLTLDADDDEKERPLAGGVVTPDAVSYSTVLHAAAAAGDAELVRSLWDDMVLRRKIRPDTVAYNARLRLAVKHGGGDDAEAFRIWDEICAGQRNSSVEPDRYTIDLMLLPLLRSGRWGDVETLLDDFVVSNSDAIVSDAFAVFLMTVARGAGLSGGGSSGGGNDNSNVMAARRLFDSYLMPSISPVVSGDAGAVRLVKVNCRHFNVMLEGYRDSIQNSSRRRPPVVREENQLSKAPDNSTALFDEAWELYDTMLKSKDYQPNEYTIATMAGLCRDSDELSGLLRQATSELGTVNTDEALLRSAMTAYGSLGDPSSASWVLSRFFDCNSEEQGSIRTWNVLLGALTDRASLSSSGDSSSLVLDLLSSTAASYLSDPGFNVSHTQAFSLLNGCTITEAALRVLNHLCSSGRSKARLRPNSQTYCLIASALQHSPLSEGDSTGTALTLFRNATKNGVAADGRFVNAVLRCFGDDIDAALSAWKTEIRPRCLKYENRLRSSPPPLQRSEGKNLVAAYHGLLYVCGRALRPEVALRLVYAMVKEGIDPNETALRCYHSGRLEREKIAGTTVSNFARRVRLINPYESMLFIECSKYDRNDKRRAGERRVRIIV